MYDATHVCPILEADLHRKTYSVAPVSCLDGTGRRIILPCFWYIDLGLERVIADDFFTNPRFCEERAKHRDHTAAGFWGGECVQADFTCRMSCSPRVWCKLPSSVGSLMHDTQFKMGPHTAHLLPAGSLMTGCLGILHVCWRCQYPYTRKYAFLLLNLLMSQ